MPRTRLVTFWPAVVLAALLVVGCDAQKALDQLARQTASPPKTTSSTTPAREPAAIRPAPLPPPAAGETLTIASFNIQVFGTSKIGKPEVTDVLARVVRQFDIVAIQEVRSKDQTVVPRFVEMVNAAGARYDHVLGPRLGRTSSKEQYAILYNTARVELVPGSVYTVDDPGDLLHREPMVARFRVRGPPAGEAFTFTLVDIHTDPDETDEELDALADVFVAVQRDGSGEDDVILLGDLNVDEYDLGRLGRLPGIANAITGTTTNTRRNKMYDNIVFDSRATQEYTGRFGVMDLMSAFRLSEEQALDVSDHLPVWAEFSVREAGRPTSVAARPGAAAEQSSR